MGCLQTRSIARTISNILMATFRGSPRGRDCMALRRRPIPGWDGPRPKAPMSPIANGIATACRSARARRLLFPVGPHVDLVAPAAALGADHARGNDGNSVSAG